MYEQNLSINPDKVKSVLRGHL